MRDCSHSTEMKTVLMRRERANETKGGNDQRWFGCFKLANTHRQALGNKKGTAYPARGGSQARQDPVMMSESDGRGEEKGGECV